jgi:hypothetical protein
MQLLKRLLTYVKFGQPKFGFSLVESNDLGGLYYG